MREGGLSSDLGRAADVDETLEPLSDRLGRKGLIVWAIWVQAAAARVSPAAVGSVLLGIGTFHSLLYLACCRLDPRVTSDVARARSLSIRFISCLD